MKSITRNIAIAFLFTGGAALAGTVKINELKTNHSRNATVIPALRGQDGGGAFDENSHVINVGLGLAGGATYYGYSRGSGYSYTRTPNFVFSYEGALARKFGPGYIGVGALFSFQNATNRYDNLYYNGGTYYYEHSWNYYTIAARGAYHWEVLMNDRAELYGGVLIGARVQSYHYKTNNPDPYYSDYYKLNEKSSYPIANVFVGARWYFAKHIGLYAEAGSGVGMSFLHGGFSFKF